MIRKRLIFPYVAGPQLILSVPLLSIRLAVPLKKLQSRGSRDGYFANPVACGAIREATLRLIRRVPYFVFLFVTHRGHQGAIEQMNKILQYHDFIDFRNKPRLDVFMDIMGKTMRARISVVYRNLDKSAFVLTSDEAMLYSEWDKSGLDWNPQRRDLARAMTRKYAEIKRDRGQVAADLHVLDETCQLSKKQITDTMCGRRAFWKKPSELKTWERWLRGDRDEIGE